MLRFDSVLLLLMNSKFTFALLIESSRGLLKKESSSILVPDDMVVFGSDRVVVYFIISVNSNVLGIVYSSFFICSIASLFCRSLCII